jgi:hypothetical protein
MEDSSLSRLHPIFTPEKKERARKDTSTGINSRRT